MQPAAADEVRTQLERMLASAPFAASARLRAFLRYVVERTLKGEGAQLKEYAIGTEVFERDEQYDPRIDSIVRVEAGRLRAKIDEYYAAGGAGDPLIIRIPRGSYVPVFETRELAAAVPAVHDVAARPRRARWPLMLALVAAAVAASGFAAWRLSGGVSARPSTDVSVAVLPFTHYAPGGADEALAARITDAVTSELARINAVGVVSRTSALEASRAQRTLPEIARQLNASTVVEGSVVSDGNTVRVRTRIVDGIADRKSAVRDFDGTRDDPDGLARRIAEALSAAFLVRRMP